jgi:hypothetical protein
MGQRFFWGQDGSSTRPRLGWVDFHNLIRHGLSQTPP